VKEETLDETLALLLYVLRAVFKRFLCLLKGDHAYSTPERVRLGTDEQGREYSTVYSICKHCRHFKSAYEVSGGRNP
jgi:hypothetical protein